MALFEVKGWNITADIAVDSEDTKKSKKNKLADDSGSSKRKAEDSDKKRVKRDRKKKHKSKSASDNIEHESKSTEQKSESTEQQSESTDPQSAAPHEKSSLVLAPAVKLTPLQQKMMAKLSGSRFRWINEQLYTTTSERALSLVQKQPELFDQYHQGFRSQVQLWPENPVEVFVEQIKSRTFRPISAPGGLPGQANKQVVIADMGCGEAQFALDINNFVKEFNVQGKKLRKKDRTLGPKPPTKLDIKVHSFDLKKANERITVADIKNVPLLNASCNIVIFCLALMGTNLLDFIQEAHRILAPNGELWIAEIKSRFSESANVGSDGQRPEVGQEFVESLKAFGFLHKKTDNSNKMFTRFELFKPPREVVEDGLLAKKKKFIELDSKKEQLELKRQKVAEGKWLLKPCIYKRR
ncbi:hypothetical protein METBISCDRAFT_18040 [Metschnikowia bicuspidata]|uniref:Ribosomal RNA-processing protein 8 n=1 Tax=Metschnikowia bicuspidata TaxID=27322 RepID=A0A4P9ZAB2_9ASCO|nr:hypothetical protein METBISCDRAFT_18040 [Metschnikowia bicuspidata]